MFKEMNSELTTHLPSGEIATEVTARISSLAPASVRTCDVLSSVHFEDEACTNTRHNTATIPPSSTLSRRDAHLGSRLGIPDFHEPVLRPGNDEPPIRCERNLGHA